jgi:hypothetical protein
MRQAFEALANLDRITAKCAKSIGRHIDMLRKFGGRHRLRPRFVPKPNTNGPHDDGGYALTRRSRARRRLFRAILL